MNKWLYKNIYWLYFFIANIRMSLYIFIGKKQKSIDIIIEHMKW